MDGAGLIENDILTKMLRMLANSYKYPKNAAINFHPHCGILNNALRMLRTLTNAVTNNANALQTPYE